jgi:hypothetical protein
MHQQRATQATEVKIRDTFEGDKCRELARAASAENEWADLRAMAQLWDLLKSA